jgi:hypothetical protein
MKPNTVQPAFLSLTAAAKQLGLSPATLCRLRRKHRLFAPCLRGVPDGNGGQLCKITRFHSRQVALIESALAGATDLETAALQWELERTRLGMAGAASRERLFIAPRGQTVCR